MFDLVDKKLVDAWKGLTTQTKVPIRLYAAVTNPPLINLWVKDMQLSLALEWVAKLAELEVVVGKTEVVVSKPKK